MTMRIYLLLFLATVAAHAEPVNMNQLLDVMESSAPVAVEETAKEIADTPRAEPDPVVTADVSDVDGSLTMLDAIELATVHDTRLVPFASALQLAQLRSGASLQRDNPELRLAADVTGDDPDMRASVRFFPLHPWAASALKQENNALAEEEAAAYQGAVLETTLETMTLFHELQCLDREKELFDRLVAIRQQAAERMERQVAAAVGTQAQGLLAQWEASETRESRRGVEIESSRLKQSLGALIGRPASRFSVNALDANDHFALLDNAKPTQAAIGNRPELQLLRAQREAADARLRTAKAANIPWLNHVEVGYRDGSGNWAVEAAIDLPFFTVLGTDKMLAYEELALREVEVETSERLIQQEVEAAVHAYNVAVNEWNSLRAGQKTLADRTRDFIESTPLDDPQQMADRLALEEKLINAELKMLDVRRSVHQALMELIAIVGKPV